MVLTLYSLHLSSSAFYTRPSLPVLSFSVYLKVPGIRLTILSLVGHPGPLSFWPHGSEHLVSISQSYVVLIFQLYPDQEMLTLQFSAIAEVIPFFSDLLSLMSSLFDSCFGFIFWGLAYIRMRRVDGRANWLREQTAYGYLMLTVNVLIIIIGFVSDLLRSIFTCTKY